MSDYTIDKAKSQYGQAKRQSVELAKSLRRIGDRRWGYIMGCSEAIGIRYCPTCGKVHVDTSWCCRHRLCAICAGRRARKTGHQAIDAFKYLREKGALPEGTGLYLVTLTQRNVSRTALRDEVQKLQDALSAMRQTRDVRTWLDGSARNVEITYNASADTLHPHVHMIAILKAGYPAEMETSAYWRKLWKRLMALSYEPICDVRPIEGTEGAICEVSKYAVKPDSIFGQNLPEKTLDMVVDAVNTAIYGKRLTTYTGIWRQARAALKQKEPDEDLEHDTDADICGCGAALMTAIMRWSGMEYVPDRSPNAQTHL
nr:unnamed protein product [uncultured bacterium]